MRSGGRVFITAITGSLLFFSFSSAEDLYVVKGSESVIDAVSETAGADIYGILKTGVLAGISVDGREALADRGFSLRSIGPRDEKSSYYIFQIEDADIEKLAPDFDVIYRQDNEAIARTRGDIDQHSILFLKQLTRVSFVPRPGRERHPTAPSINLQTDPEIEEIVSHVDQGDYTAIIQRLQNFLTRYSPTDSCRAAEQWAIEEFASLGYETELFPFTYSGQTWHDAIGRKTGAVYPDSIYIIIGHLDATSENPNVLAPGAEDNGSGSACVLECARVLSQYDFNCTIEFVMVTGEEQGLYGSEAYAYDCYTNNRNIAGVLNFDMIAYAGGYGWDTNIFSDQTFPAEVALADLLALVTDDYTAAYSIRVNTVGPEYGSDHYYFSYYGFPAPFSIDAQLWSAPDWYPWYHTTSDVIDNLDLDYATEVVRGAVAAMATIAGLWSPPLLEFNYPDGLPQLIDPSGGTAFRVEIIPGASDPQPGTGLLYYDDGGGFTSVPMDIVSPNIYDAVFPATECDTEVRYYLSAETIDGAAVTDPPGAPDESYSVLSATGFVSVFEDDFNSDRGWSVENSCADGQWERAVPAGGGDRGDPPSDYDGSGYCYVTDNADDNSDVDDGYTRLISPIFDTDGDDAIIEYALWYTNNAGDNPNSDIFNVDVSSDGGTNWTSARTFGPHTMPGWTIQSFRVAEFVTPSGQIRVRFEASDLGGGSVVEAGIDAVVVKRIECLQLPTGTIEGTVSDLDGPLTGVQVVAEGTGITDETDTGGSYILAGLTVGTYDISFSLIGYRDTTVTGMEVFENQTTTLDMVMEPTQDIPALSEWGMILLSLLLVAVGTARVIRDRKWRFTQRKRA